MVSSYSKKLFSTISILGIVFSIIQIFGDIAWIKEHLTVPIYLYLIPRAFICIGFVSVYLFYKNKILTDNSILFLGGLLTIYSVHGQQFVPGYFMAYLQSILAISLFFALPKNRFVSFLVLSGLFMIFSVGISNATYSKDLALIAKFRADVGISIVIINILSFFGYRFITLTRQQKDAAMLKFLDIGRNSASIIHDIKGVASTPQLYIEMISQKLQEGDYEGANFAIKKLQANYSNLVEYVRDLNEVSKEKEGVRKIDIMALIDSTANIFLKSKTKGIKISFKGSQFLEADFQLTRTVLSNLFVNSAEAFDSQKTPDRQINLEISKQKIKFYDNAGGFPLSVLERIKRKESFTTKENGSGLGIYLIQEYMAEQGGKANFYNENNGAVVELYFKDFDKINKENK